jgi:hypothetical protein
MKSCILCPYPDSKTAFRWFVDTMLTFFIILCYCIVQGNKYRPGGSHMNPIQSPSIWKQQFRLKRRNECTTLPDVITPLFIYHRSYKIFARYNVLKQRTFPNLRPQDPIYLHSPKSEHRPSRSVFHFSDHTNATTFRTQQNVISHFRSWTLTAKYVPR